MPEGSVPGHLLKRLDLALQITYKMHAPKFSKVLRAIRRTAKAFGSTNPSEMRCKESVIANGLFHTIYLGENREMAMNVSKK